MEYDSLINIHVKTRYLPEQSSAKDNKHAFAYTITISNHSPEPVQLLSRHWIITDANEQVQEVRGDGVVGEQPLIESGDSYSYTSGALLNTSAGTMQGSYQMRSASGVKFEAPISLFALTHPASLH